MFRNHYRQQEILLQDLGDVRDLEIKVFPCLLDMKWKGVKVNEDQVAVLEKKLACAPCYSSRCRILTHACMKDIRAEEVMREVELFMKEPS